MFVIEATLPKASDIALFIGKQIPLTTKEVMRKGVEEWKNVLAQYLNENLSDGGIVPAGEIRKIANVRNITAEETSDGFKVSLRHVPPMARAHEVGAKITPQKADHLAIPVGPAVGPPRRTPRMYKNTFMLPEDKLKRADKVIMWKKSRTDYVPIFALMKEVQLKRRPWFASAVRDAWPSMADILDDLGA